MKHLISIIFLLIYVSTSNASEATSLINKSWPQRATCNNCLPIKFGSINLEYPVSKIKNLEIMNFDTASLGIELVSETSTFRGIVFLVQPLERILEPFKINGLLNGYQIKSASDFFELIGSINNNDKNLETIKKIMGVSDATSYTRHSSGEMIAYFIKTNDLSKQAIYLTINNDENVYQISGDIEENVGCSILEKISIQ